MQHAAGGGAHVESAGFDDRVRDPHRLDRKWTDLVLFARVRLAQVELTLREVVLVQATTRDLERVRRAPHRQLELREQVRQRADVIFVAVRQEDAVHAITLFDQPAEIRMPNVDAHVVVGEGGAAIDDHDAVLLLERKAVHADLPQASEGDDPNPIGGSSESWGNAHAGLYSSDFPGVARLALPDLSVRLSSDRAR